MARAWAGHRWLGIAFSLPLFVVCLSGALLVRYDWVERVTDPALFRGDGEDPRPPLHKHLAALAATRPEARLRFVELPGDPDRNVVVTLQENGDFRTVILDAATGATVVDRPQDHGPRRWLLRLHEELLLGAWGRVVVAASSLVLMGSAATGLWIYRGAWRGLWRPKFRWNRGLRLAAGDVHRFFGVFSLALLFVWGATGALLTIPALPGVFAADRAPQVIPQGFAWAEVPAIEPLLAEAQRQFPTAEVDYLSLPVRPEGRFTVSLIERGRWLWAKFKEVEFDGREGTLVAVRDYAAAGLLDRVNFTVAVLHFGHQGSAVMRWTWFVFGFAPVMLTVTGLIIVWSRRRQR